VTTKERFFEGSGVGNGIRRGWIETELIPAVRIERHRLVNRAIFGRLFLDQEFLTI
jgi:hypothetical protein